MRANKFRKGLDLSVWVIASAISVLVIVVVAMSLTQFRQHENRAAFVFVEKGATLIASLEAGLQTADTKASDPFQLQKLVMATARQPDIDYLIVTDSKGGILADSDPTLPEDRYGLDLDLAVISAQQEIAWRQTVNPGGAGTFEVYSSFLPAGQAKLSDTPAPWIAYVGFNMGKIEKSRQEDRLHTALVAFALALVGSLAIISLFLVQAYRLTKKSLSRVRVFSEALVKNMPIGLLGVDSDGKILTCNHDLQDLLAAPCEDAVGLRADKALAAPFVKLLESVNEQHPIAQRDMVYSRPGAADQIWEALAARLPDEETPGGKILLARNVTDQRQMEKEVARSRHLNAIGTLAAGVAHEIRNPLSSIKGFAVYFKERLKGHTEDEETADILIAETERLNRAVSGLIDFASPLKLKKEQHDLPALVAHTSRIIESLAQKQAVALDIEAAQNLPQVSVDPDKVQQALLNVFLNALAAMPGGGQVSISFQMQKDFLAVMISDTGAGISKEDLPRIFDPYFTSKPQGSGLGLAIVQKIMNAHAGVIEIESREGGGTTVTLRFPINSYEGINS